MSTSLTASAGVQIIHEYTPYPGKSIARIMTNIIVLGKISIYLLRYRTRIYVILQMSWRKRLRCRVILSVLLFIYFDNSFH